jgi:hypothetical protein
MIWLDKERGYATDWITQRWVRFTGRRVDLQKDAWLDGPVGQTARIGLNFFQEFAQAHGLKICRTQDCGLLADFRMLGGGEFDPTHIDPGIAEFYQQTSAYQLDAWAEWTGVFRPFGKLLAVLFNRRLQQLNVPLSALDTSQGMTSEVFNVVDPANGEIRWTAWVRQLLGSGNVLYAGSYSICTLPGYANPCVKVVFPLPNGNAIVIMRPEAHADRSFSLISSGQRFGEPGFYFTVHTPRGVYARYVRALRESIRVYAGEAGVVRADHVLRFFGLVFLRIHYRLTRRAETGFHS